MSITSLEVPNVIKEIFLNRPTPNNLSFPTIPIPTFTSTSTEPEIKIEPSESIPDSIPQLPHPESSFTEAYSIDAKHYGTKTFTDFITHHCTQNDHPILIRNAAQIWGISDSQNSMFTLGWLGSQLSSSSITVHDVELALDHKMSMEDFILYQRLRYDTDQHVYLYGKELKCPNEWKQLIFQRIPDEFKYCGKSDLFKYLPEEVKDENVTMYIGLIHLFDMLCLWKFILLCIGSEKTYSPMKIPKVGSFGYNLMVGGDNQSSAMWCMIPATFKDKLESLIEQANQSLHSAKYYCPVDVLKSVSFPVYFCEQKPGDLIILPPNTSYQVLNQGTACMKVAWNRLPAQNLDTLFDVLKVNHTYLKPESIPIKSIVRKALNVVVDTVNQHLPTLSLEQKSHSLNELKSTLRFYYRAVASEIVQEKYSMFQTDFLLRPEEITYVSEPELNRTLRCSFCRLEIWNLVYCCTICSELARIHNFDDVKLCLDCYAHGRSCKHPENLQMKKRMSLKSMRADFDNAVDALEKLTQDLSEAGVVVEPIEFKWIIPIPDEVSIASVARIREISHKVHISNGNTKNYCQNKGPRTCHCCKTARNYSGLVGCGRVTLHGLFCQNCLWNRFGLKQADVLKIDNWRCPLCTETCNCIACLRKRGSMEMILPMPKDFVSISNYKHYDPNMFIPALHDLELPKIKSKEITVVDPITGDIVFSAVNSSCSSKRVSRDSSVERRMLSESPRASISNPLKKRTHVNEIMRLLSDNESDIITPRKRRIRHTSTSECSTPTDDNIFNSRISKEKRKTSKIAIDKEYHHEDEDEDTTSNLYFALDSLKNPIWKPFELGRIWVNFDSVETGAVKSENI
ncbi:hypothetical protein HK098_004840 [Nowakowskiella sp. JEL0407]|nr:hypothetical protein HK098_004840 [Nowakowskiella sp. JEL0407]